MRKKRNASKNSKCITQCRVTHMHTDITGLEGKSCGILNGTEVSSVLNNAKVSFWNWTK